MKKKLKWCLSKAVPVPRVLWQPLLKARLRGDFLLGASELAEPRGKPSTQPSPLPDFPAWGLELARSAPSSGARGWDAAAVPRSCGGSVRVATCIFQLCFSLLPAFWFFPVTEAEVLSEFSSAFSDETRPVQPKAACPRRNGAEGEGSQLQTPLLISLVSAGEQQFYVEFAIFPLPSVIWRIPVMFPGRVVFTVRAPHNQGIEES